MRRRRMVDRVGVSERKVGISSAGFGLKRFDRRRPERELLGRCSSMANDGDGRKTEHANLAARSPSRFGRGFCLRPAGSRCDVAVGLDQAPLLLRPYRMKRDDDNSDVKRCFSEKMSPSEPTLHLAVIEILDGGGGCR